MRKTLCLLLAVLVIVLVGCQADTKVKKPSQTEGESIKQPQNESTEGTQNVQPSVPEQTQPVPETESTTPPQTEPTDPQSTESQPSEGTTVETTPGGEQTETCTHNYEITATVVSTCTAAGTERYTCTLCGSGYTKNLPLLAHSFANATCVTPKTCVACGTTEGSALGHSWNSYNYCAGCGIRNPAPQTGPVLYTVNLKSDENAAIPGATVCVYTTSQTQPAGTAVTNNKGVATMTLEAHTSYKVVIADLPAGYEAKESYSFTGTVVSISLKSLPVYDPMDHSRARYKVGDTMADFTLTDTEGNTYTLSQLKKTKKLIILDFFYNTCNPCKAEFPLFEAAMEKYGDQIILLAVNPYNDMASIRALREELGYTFPMVTDAVKLSDGFKVTEFPTTVFVDNTGKIRKIHRGDFLRGTTATQADIDSFLNTIKSYL